VSRDPHQLTVFELRGQRGAWVANFLDPRDGRAHRIRLYQEHSGDAGYVPPSKRTKAAAWARAVALVQAWREEPGASAQATEDELTLDAFVALALRDPGRPRVSDVLSPATLARKREVLQRFRTFIGELPSVRGTHRGVFGNGPAREITPHMLDSYVDARKAQGLKRGLIRELSILRRAFAHAIERKYLPAHANPVPSIAQHRDVHAERESRRSLAFTQDELDVMLRHCQEPLVERLLVTRSTAEDPYTIRQEHLPPSYFLPLFTVAAETGLRPGELYGLRWVDVDFGKHMLQVRKESSKSFGRWVPIHPSAEEALRQLSTGACSVFVFTLNGRPLRRNDHEHAMRRYLKRLAREYPHLSRLGTRTMKSFRHYFAFTRAAHWPVHKLRTVLGHADIRTTAIYLHAEAFDLCDEFRALPPTLRPSTALRPSS
jgi:integrase